MATPPEFLPGEFHEQRNLAGCSPQGHKKSDMTELLTLSLSLSFFLSLSFSVFLGPFLSPSFSFQILSLFSCFLSFFFPFIFISWRLITSQHFSGFCHTLT